MPYTMSIETKPGETYQHGFHLGTIERTAREIVQDKMRTCRENDWPAVTMGLLWDGKLVDTLYRDGTWHSASHKAFDAFGRERGVPHTE
jgi:hypothetical protein